MTLEELKAEHTAAVAKRLEIMTTGQGYNISGSHSVENTDLRALNEHISNLERRILRYQGYTGRTAPNFGGA